ncbi:MAG: kynureninase, partial [Planctomycetota bacterium]
WIEAPQRLGAKLAPLLGAEHDEVIVADSTSVNLFKLLVAAVRLRPDRKTILMEKSNFPTDIYVAQGVVELHPELKLVLVGEEELESSLHDDVAVVLLTHVDYKSSRLHDMTSVTKSIHEVGALVIWDLSHSTGAVPLNLNECQADMAAGCGYKYLNGGPGAPAFMFVSKRHLLRTMQPITAWIGHDKPFEFSLDYVPAANARRLLSGTPTILSMAALEAALDLWGDLDIHQVREKSISLSELFIRVIQERLREASPTLVSPRSPSQRGGHVALSHPHGFEIVQALIDCGVIGDFREPDVMRFGFAPLYLSFTDTWRAAVEFVDVLQSNTWNQSKYRQRAAVT